jgi:metallo-beta-lactamase family protein
MSSLSGHADRTELLSWMANFMQSPKLVFTVHGEKNAITPYAQEIRDRFHWNVLEPVYLETVALFSGI